MGRACGRLARDQCARVRYLGGMSDKRFFDNLNERISAAFRDSPAQDIEKNLKAMLATGFARLPPRPPPAREKKKKKKGGGASAPRSPRPPPGCCARTSRCSRSSSSAR